MPEKKSACLKALQARAYDVPGQLFVRLFQHLGVAQDDSANHQRHYTFIDWSIN